MRIAQVVINPNGGGAERVASILASNLQNSGLQSVVVSVDPSPEIWANQSCIILNKVRLPPFYRELAAAISLRRFLAKNEVTHLHAHCETSELVASLAIIGRRRIKIFVTEHTDRPWNQHLMIGFLVRTYLRLRRVKFSNCSDFGEHWMQNGSVKFIPNYLRSDLPILEAANTQNVGFLRILIMQRLVGSKNVLEILNAASRANFKGDVIIVGDGYERPQLEKVATELCLRFTFYGYRANPWLLFRRGDLVVSASEYEGQPMAISEAIAMDAPILLSNIPGHKFAVSKAWQVFNSQEELVDRFQSLMQGTISLSDLRSDSFFRDKFLEVRDPKVLTAEWMKFYNEVEVT